MRTFYVVGKCFKYFSKYLNSLKFVLFCVLEYTLTTELQNVLSVPLIQFNRSDMSDFFDTMNCSRPGLPVHQQPSEFTQTHIH